MEAAASTPHGGSQQAKAQSQLSWQPEDASGSGLEVLVGTGGSAARAWFTR